MTQPNLFDTPDPAPYVRHSQTSKAAAVAIAPKAASLRDRVYAYIASRPDGATDEDVCVALNIEGSTARPRRIDLVQRGLVRDSGRTRENRASGRQMTVWVVTK